MDDILDRLDEEYWADVDEDWRSIVCTDDVLSEVEYRAYLEAWWDYEEDAS